MSQTIDVKELSKLTGISRPTLLKYVQRGSIPALEDEKGRKRFKPDEATKAIAKLEIKPRKRKGATQATQESETSSIPTELVNAIEEALEDAQMAFKISIEAHMREAVRAKNAPICLALAGIGLGSQELFDEVRITLLDGDRE